MTASNERVFIGEPVNFSDYLRKGSYRDESSWGDVPCPNRWGRFALIKECNPDDNSFTDLREDSRNRNRIPGQISARSLRALRSKILTSCFMKNFSQMSALPLSLREGSAFPINPEEFGGSAAEAKPQTIVAACGKPAAFRKESGKAAKIDRSHDSREVLVPALRRCVPALTVDRTDHRSDAEDAENAQRKSNGRVNLLDTLPWSH
jgi:hypothetical protein